MNYGEVSTRENIEGLLKALEQKLGQLESARATVDFRNQRENVPRYPIHVQDLDTCANTILSAGDELDADHPGFKDEAYRKRRKVLAEVAAKYKQGEKIPRIEYSDNEISAWRVVYNALVNKTIPQYACSEYREVFPLFQRNCGFGPNQIPQLQDVSDFLKETTGFTIRPTAGMLSSRDFLSSLAFRVFRCTQYIRHHTKPLYTPEPDACHELLGHVPLLANPDFAQFSQEFGLMTLGASDELIGKLASLYWYTMEYGLCMENNQTKVYGAGLLSAPEEVQHCFSGKPQIKQFEPDVVANSKYPLTELNWHYFVVRSFTEARHRLMEWALPTRDFQLRYNPYSHRVEPLDNVAAIKRFASDIKGDLAKLENSIEKVCRTSF